MQTVIEYKDLKTQKTFKEQGTTPLGIGRGISSAAVTGDRDSARGLSRGLKWALDFKDGRIEHVRKWRGSMEATRRLSGHSTGARVSCSKPSVVAATEVWDEGGPQGIVSGRKLGRIPGGDKLEEAGVRNLWNRRTSWEAAQDLKQYRVVYFRHSRRVTDTSEGPSSTTQSLLAPYATEYSSLVPPSNRRPSQRQSGGPGDLRASQLVEPDYGEVQSDIVLRASFEESSELTEEDRYRVVGTFWYTSPTNKPSEAQERPGLWPIDFLGTLKPSSPTREELRPLHLQIQALQIDTMYFSPHCGGANRGAPLPMFDRTGVRN
ncbi:hypothetical protein Efla_006219 [Eimeria flavescens]